MSGKEKKSPVPIKEFNYTENPRVAVDKAQLDELIQQNQDLKFTNGQLLSDMHTLVKAFNGLQGLFKGKVTMTSIIPVIMKLVNNPEKMGELGTIVPIIEKYNNMTLEITSNAKG